MRGHDRSALATPERRTSTRLNLWRATRIAARGLHGRSPVETNRRPAWANDHRHYRVGIPTRAAASRLSTATWRYQCRPDVTNLQLRQRLQAHGAERPRFGYRRLHTLVDREGLHVNHKRVYGVYREAGLQVRRRRRKRLTGGAAGAAARTNWLG
jgi:HTH-like domain